MSNRWSILALLFSIRVTMAFQYQAVAALSPFVMTKFGVGLADIGLLIGLYVSPGIVIALPGGAIGRRFGDKQTVAFGLVLMLAGGLIVAFGATWPAQIVGRVVAGTGGVILNVLMSKMVTDWFIGRNLATAMGIFVNSWPVGIAAALLVAPYSAEFIGYSATMAAISGLIAIGLAMLVAFYRPPAGIAAASLGGSAPLRGRALILLLLAAGIWGSYNAALSMIFAFGPAMLAERGWSPQAASSTTSIVLWIVAVSVPLGGLIADRTGRRDLVLFSGLSLFAVLMVFTPGTSHVVFMFLALGVVCGLAAGPIMSLPGEVLTPGNRAHGMGVFYSLYYLMTFATQVVAGRLSDATGTAGTAFLFGGAMLAVCLLFFAMFTYSARRAAVLS